MCRRGQFHRTVVARDVRGPGAVLGEGKRDVGDLTGDLADDLSELLDAETPNVLPAGGGVLVRPAPRVHDLAAHPSDAVGVQAAESELDAESGVDPGRVDYQVAHAVGEAVDRLSSADQEAEGRLVLLGDGVPAQSAERVTPVGGGWLTLRVLNPSRSR